jgi:hypothetical protein
MREHSPLVGFLINKFQGSSFLHSLLRISPRHWMAVRRVGDKYQFLDSKEEDYLIFDKD